MSKEVKTNAMRILDRQKIPYRVIQYECDEFIDGLHTAQKTGAPVEQSFKTLVTRGKSGGFYVMVVPIAEELNLKQAARQKEINGITGYVRGGCSPIGMKKQFPTFIHDSAEKYGEIYISGGRIGTTLCLSPTDLQKACRGSFGKLT